MSSQCLLLSFALGILLLSFCLQCRPFASAANGDLDA
jgi:hypothetical protein